MGKEPDELRREIDEVRADIGETVEQLSARVSPRQRATAKAQQAKGLLHRLRHAPMADSMLGVVYAPLFPFVDKVHLNRHKRRTHNPSHVLVPDGCTVEVVASDFNEPVHCCFGDDGFACVTECGHKIDSKPRIVKVDTTTGASETFFELPFDRWRETGAVTGSCWNDGSLYLMNTHLSRLTPEGRLEDRARPPSCRTGGSSAHRTVSSAPTVASGIRVQQGTGSLWRIRRRSYAANAVAGWWASSWTTTGSGDDLRSPQRCPPFSGASGIWPKSIT